MDSLQGRNMCLWLQVHHGSQLGLGAGAKGQQVLPAIEALSEKVRSRDAPQVGAGLLVSGQVWVLVRCLVKN